MKPDLQALGWQASRLWRRHRHWQKGV